MKKLLWLFILFIAPVAYAQNVSPGTEFFLGGSLGKQWLRAMSEMGGVNSQTGTTYTIVGDDIGKLVAINNGSAIAVTLPQAGTVGFEAFKQFCIVDIGAGSATVTPTTSTINGAATKVYATGASGCIVSDGTNYWAR